MELLLPGDTVFDRYRVQAMVGAGGQACGFSGIDLRAPRNRPWERNVFLKQYHSFPADKQVLAEMRVRSEKFRTRLAEK